MEVRVKRSPWNQEEENLRSLHDGLYKGGGEKSPTWVGFQWVQLNKWGDHVLKENLRACLLRAGGGGDRLDLKMLGCLRRWPMTWKGSTQIMSRSRFRTHSVTLYLVSNLGQTVPMPKSHILFLLYPCFCCCLVAQSCLTLCDPMDHSPPGSSVHGIVQARILEWVATSSSRGFSQTQGLNLCPLCFLHCRQILYLLSTRGSHVSSWQNISPLISSPECMPCVWQDLDPLEKGSWRGRPSFSPEELLAISFIGWCIGHVNNKFIFLLLVPREGLAVNPPSCFISHLCFYKNTLLFFLTGSLCTGSFILYFLLCFNGIILLTWDHLGEYSHGTCSPAMWQYCC